MKTIKVNYNLQKITQSPEANLSDFFIILYAMFLIEKNGAKPSRYSLNKLFPYIFDVLEREGKLEYFNIFNLPFYKYKGGHFNISLDEVYLKKLKNSKLIKQSPSASYVYALTKRAKNLMQKYYKEEREKSEAKDFENIVKEFTSKFLRERNNKEIKDVLYSFSHTVLVVDDNKKIRVDELENNYYKAIAYNNKDFQKGRIADIVSQQYLTLLAYEFQKHQPVEKEDKDILNNLLSSFSD